MNFTKLTRLDGEPVYVGDSGSVIQEAVADQSTPKAKTEISWGGTTFFVTEPLDIVLHRLESMK
jgi:hypothetical protein